MQYKFKRVVLRPSTNKLNVTSTQANSINPAFDFEWFYYIGHMPSIVRSGSSFTNKDTMKVERLEL